MDAVAETRTARPARLDVMPHRALQLLKSDLGLTARDLAGALAVDRRTLDRWTTGRTHPQHEARARLAALLGLRERLLASLGGLEFAREWLKTPSLYLGHLTPLEVLRAGRPDRVEANLEAFDAGVAL
ncbi:MAG: helix-turn-helix transcriptional regulator [Chloroflexi bacterium]|nr:helix-turn-helix transcriptional regulator [Chloroflexota bacterium]